GNNSQGKSKPEPEKEENPKRKARGAKSNQEDNDDDDPAEGIAEENQFNFFARLPSRNPHFQSKQRGFSSCGGRPESLSRKIGVFSRRVLPTWWKIEFCWCRIGVFLVSNVHLVRTIRFSI
ncbi:AAEL001700-PA, partial [Aedes aegypti]